MKKREENLWEKFKGEVAVVEDGTIVLYVIDRDERGYGVATVTRIPTSVRASQSNIDPALFPLPAVYEPSLVLGGHHIIVPDAANRLRKVRVDAQSIKHLQSTRTKQVIPETQLTDKESEKRWYYIRQKLTGEGRLFVTPTASRLPKHSKEMFLAWAEAVAKGMDEDQATDFLYDNFNQEPANDFLRGTRLSNGWRFSPKHAHPSNMVFMLEGKNSKYKPLACYGEIPEIDWTSLPW